MSVCEVFVGFSEKLGGAGDPESGRPEPSSVVRFPLEAQAETFGLVTVVALSQMDQTYGARTGTRADHKSNTEFQETANDDLEVGDWHACQNDSEAGHTPNIQKADDELVVTLMA